MRRHILLAMSLTLATAGPLHAGTFGRTPIAPDQGIDVLNRRVARELVGRTLFAHPYATVTFGTLDVYDVFPYVENRRFQVVSDPEWNRLVFGEAGKSLSAYDGQGSPLGALAEPRGMDVDEANRVYLADTGNDRVLVLKAVTEFETMTLVPLYEIRGLRGPYDVAHSDAGTPFEPADDRLIVADTGRNRVVAYALENGGARELGAVGELGSGRGRFGGPMAVAVGRAGGVNTDDVYVADAHGGRIVHLRLDRGSLDWISEQKDGAGVLTSLDSDHWGNVYASAPRSASVQKFNADLSPVATLREDASHPRSFNVPFLNVHDHRSGRVERMGQPNGLMVEDWTEHSGLKLWQLGLEVAGLAVVDADGPVARFTLTDQAHVSYEIQEAGTGRVLARRSIGSLRAGLQTVPLLESEVSGALGGRDRVLRLTAQSDYREGPSDVAQAPFAVSGGGAVVAPTRPQLLGNTPNPFSPSTRIAFLLPVARTDGAQLRVFDASGRMVRTFGGPFSPGLNEVVWDGRDADGTPASPGVYFSRLSVGGEQFTLRMVLVR